MTGVGCFNGTGGEGKAEWRKSSYSGGNDNCVEVAGFDSRVSVRDSKVPTGAAAFVSPVAWGEFVVAVVEGKLN